MHLPLQSLQEHNNFIVANFIEEVQTKYRDKHRNDHFNVPLEHNDHFSAVKVLCYMTTTTSVRPNTSHHGTLLAVTPSFVSDCRGRLCTRHRLQTTSENQTLCS